MSTDMNPSLLAMKYKACSGSDERGGAKKSPWEYAKNQGLQKGSPTRQYAWTLIL
jgi:hypothetical protein